MNVSEVMVGYLKAAGVGHVFGYPGDPNIEFMESARRAGHDPDRLPVSINSHGFIADDGDAAASLAFGPYSEVMGRIGRERGWPPPSRRQFDAERSPDGALLIGNPQQVIDKILYEHELFGNQRFLIQLTVGSMPHDAVMRAIELYGTVVAPAVREAIRARVAV